MRLTIISILLWVQIAGFGQESNEIQFIDYSSVINDICSKAPKSDLTTKWNYNSILLLDTAHITEIKTIRPDIVTDFRKVYNLAIPDRYKKLLLTNSKNIRDFFVKKELLDMLFSAFDNGIDIKNKNLGKEVYVKDDLEAIYSIYGDSWSEYFRISITKDGLLIELLSQISE